MSNVSADRPVLIVGGGLAGLTVAHRIHRAGINFHLLEARPRLGGRILSVDASGQTSVDGFDLGPSWFWLDMQPAFDQFVGSSRCASTPRDVPARMPHPDASTLRSHSPSRSPHLQIESENRSCLRVTRKVCEKWTCVDAPSNASGIFCWLRACGQVLTCVRPLDAAVTRRGPLWKSADQVQYAYAGSICAVHFAGSPDPVFLTVCP